MNYLIFLPTLHGLERANITILQIRKLRLSVCKLFSTIPVLTSPHPVKIDTARQALANETRVKVRQLFK